MVCFVILGGVCGWKQWTPSPSSVPQRFGQCADPRHPQQGPHEKRRADCDGAHLLHPGEHHLVYFDSTQVCHNSGLSPISFHLNQDRSQGPPSQKETSDLTPKSKKTRQSMKLTTD